MPKVYIYFNIPDRHELPESELAALDASGYTIDMRRIVLERVPCSRPSAERPELWKMLRRMMPTDMLVVTELGFLGNSVRDLLATLQWCRRKRLRVRCEGLGSADLAGTGQSIAVKTLLAVAELERQSASARVRENVANARGEGRAFGRPPSLTAQQRARVLDRLARGATVSEVARQFQTSRQTVIRIRAGARAEDGG